MSKLGHFGMLTALVTVVAAGSVAAAPVALRASHQFPGGKGDVRDEMVQIIARDAKAAGVDLDVQVYPGASLFKPNEQWNAHGQRPARHLVVSARLRERQGARIRRHADARAGAQPRARGAAGQFQVHEGHQGQDRASRRDRAVGRMARRRRRLQEELHPHAGRHQGPEDPLGGPDVRGDVAGRRRVDRLDPQQRGLQRAADRRRRSHRYQHGQLRLVPDLRAGQVHHRAGRQRAVVHVRAGADVEEELRPPRQEAAGRAAQGRQKGRRTTSPRKARASTTRWSRRSRSTRSRSSR